MSEVDLGGEVEPKALATECGCAQCGGTGITYTEAHRHACEVRFVADMKSKEARRLYLAGVQLKRGAEARSRIIDSLKEMVK